MWSSPTKIKNPLIMKAQWGDPDFVKPDLLLIANHKPVTKLEDTEFVWQITLPNLSMNCRDRV